MEKEFKNEIDLHWCIQTVIYIKKKKSQNPFPEEEYSLLSNLPEAANVDEDSDEFQSVVKSFYETILDYHNKIRIIKVTNGAKSGVPLCFTECCRNLR